MTMEPDVHREDLLNKENLLESQVALVEPPKKVEGEDPPMGDPVEC